MQLKWTNLADSDLEEIETYIAEDNGPIVAMDVVMNIIDSVQNLLPEHPRAGRQGRVNNTRELVIDGLPFVVIYRENVRHECVEILRVLHEAQQWPTSN